MHYMQH